MEGISQPVVGVGWLAAALAPWAVSPHPNFSRPHAPGPGLLALVTEHRADEFSSDSLDPDEHQETWVLPLLAAARGSLSAQTQASSISQLAGLSVNTNLPAGARAAAALYAANALAEDDQLEGASSAAGQCLETMPDPPSGAHPSLSLIRCALHLQIAMREWELGRFDATIASLESFDSDHQDCQPGSAFEDFAVSPGISWEADIVQADVSRALRWRAVQLRSRLEGPGGTSWQDVVRTRPSWVDVRIDWTKAERDRKVIRAAFDAETPGSSDRVVFGGETIPGVVAGYASMWQAELGGDLGEALQCRESLAQLVLLEREKFGPATAIPEALRLMRRSGSKDGLRTAISIARSEGPVGALVVAMNEVVKRPSFPSRVSVQDMRLLEGSVDLIGEADVAPIILGALNYLRFDYDERRTYRDPSLALGVLASLAKRFPAVSGQIAEEVIDLLDQPNFQVLSVGRETAQLARAIDWGVAGESPRHRWTEWAHELERNDSLRDVGASVRTVLDPRPDSAEIVIDSSQALISLINDPAANWTVAQSSAAVSIIMAEIDRTVAQSTTGVRSFGAWDSAELAALVALKTSNEMLWERLVAFLANPAVEADLKSGALSRLAEGHSKVPEGIRSEFPDIWTCLVLQRPLDPPLSTDRSPYFPAALRFGTRFELEPASYFISVSTAMAGERSARVRQHAARLCCDVIDTFGVVTWGQAMILNLTRDADLSIRSTACRILVEASVKPGELDGVVHTRIEEVLADDSIRLPLSALHGFQVLATMDGGTKGFAAHAGAIGRLAEDHQSATVRGAAENAIAAHDNRST